MNKLTPFIRLDFATVKPYLTTKNLLVFIVVALIMMLADNSATGAIAILMLFAALHAGYPFAIGEKSNIDILYITLSVPRKTVVLGRYLFALLLDVSVSLFAFIFSFIVMFLTRNDFVVIEALITILLLFVFFSLVQAIQLPIYFKLGYTKAKFLSILPFVILPLMFAVLGELNLFGDIFSAGLISGLLEWLLENIAVATLLGVALWSAIIFVSYLASISFYTKRDF
jgi:hypothetical protein